MASHRMYHDLAYLWPAVSPPEGYRVEASHWRDALREMLGPGRHRILELGVGGGNNLSHLTGDFAAAAVDSSEAMLSNSRRLNPDVEHHVGDMRTIRLNTEFDAVIIHDAISYLLSEDDIIATLATVSSHFGNGGIFITAPDWYRETFKETHRSHKTHSAGGTEVTLFEYTHDPDPDDTLMESIFLFVIKDSDVVRVEEDRHVTGLFPLDTWLRLMRDAGFQVEKRPYPVHDDGHEAYLLAGVVA